MKSLLAKVQVLGLLIALPALANDVGLHKGSAQPTRAGDATTTRILGVCAPSPNQDYSLENVVEPIYEAQAYFQTYEHRTVSDSATTTVLQQPKHGVLRLVTEADGNTFGEGRFVAANQLYVYLPVEGYEGKDNATILVDFGGLKVKVKYYFQAISGPLGNTGLERLCAKTGIYWKISSTLDTKATVPSPQLNTSRPSRAVLTHQPV